MDQNSFDPLRQHLIYQMSQNLLRLQLEASKNSLSSLGSPTLSTSTPPSPFINWPSTPTSTCHFNWPSPMNWPSTPTMPYMMPNPQIKSETRYECTPPPPPTPTAPVAVESRGYSRWWESDDDKENVRTSSGGDSGRGSSQTPSSVEHDEDEEVFVQDPSNNGETPPSTGNSKHRILPLKKRPRNLPPIVSSSNLQNPDISSTCHYRAPMTLPAPFTLPVTPLSIPNTPHSMPASPWHILLQRHQMWNSGAPFSPIPGTPSSPQFFRFPPPPSFLSPQSELSTSSSTSPLPSTADQFPASSPVTKEWLEGLQRQVAVLPSDSIHLLPENERLARLNAMSQLTEDQYDNVRRYLEKRSYSVRDDIGKDDYVPRPIVLRSEFVSLHCKNFYLV